MREIKRKNKKKKFNLKKIEKIVCTKNRNFSKGPTRMSRKSQSKSAVYSNKQRRINTTINNVDG